MDIGWCANEGVLDGSWEVVEEIFVVKEECKAQKIYAKLSASSKIKIKILSTGPLVS